MIKQLTTCLLPLRDIVVFPYMVVPLFVGRKNSILALEEAMKKDKRIFLVTQKDPDQEDPVFSDLYEIGTLAEILQMVKLSDGTVKVLVEGIARKKLNRFESNESYIVEIEDYAAEFKANVTKEKSLCRSLINSFDYYLKIGKRIPAEIITSVSNISSIEKLSDTIAANLVLKIEQKQSILAESNPYERVNKLLNLIEGEVGVLEIEKKIRGRVKSQMEKTQRDYYLNEQMKAIQKEIEDGDDSPNEIEELANKIVDAKMPELVNEKANAELGKLKSMSPMAAEATVVRNYLEWLIKLPWGSKTKVFKDLSKAEKILNKDHHGLDKVKERILEFLAVQQRVSQIKGPILCLVGPPGVGKTSLGESIARATNRKFIRMSLGGVRDEAEIRGHRKTYIGSMPGKIIQSMVKAKSNNPLFLLDEIDKMAMDYRGDPASALLEALDPEQNHSFADHYLEVDYDLTNVMFICTANSLNIPPALLDRMEVIRLPGYTETEKVSIAKGHLVAKQIKNAGIKKGELKIADNALLDIVRYYTREAGVRGIERAIAKLCRKVVRESIESKEEKTIRINAQNLDKYLGVKRYDFGKKENENAIGQVTGLAWTEVGGEVLRIESAVVPGKGKLIHTGHLGEVMQESIQAALTVVRSRSESLGIDADFNQKYDVHIHVPEGATPKDGPSAGVGMCASMVSSLTKIPIRADVAMTGEITLNGQVLPIGGLKEKLLAAARGGISTVLIPDGNKKDLEEIPNEIKDKITIIPVKWIDQVLDLALERPPRPLDMSAKQKDQAKPDVKEKSLPEQSLSH
jgi:ATP-dependent Lon protease